jgi:hypothetical protein
MVNDKDWLSRQSVKISQGNYDKYVLPELLAKMGNVSLYIVVAYWGLLLKRPFYRDEVASVFKIDQRKAADIMSYISHRRQDIIQSKIHYEGMVGRKRRYISIVSIKHEFIYTDRRKDEFVCSDDADKSINDISVNELRKLFLRGSIPSK